jgi:arylsulfatase A-like enzyme
MTGHGLQEQSRMNETQMKNQRVSATWLFVLMVGMILTTANNVIAADHQPAVPPNIVLFLVDDMGWMDSTPYGSQYYETPNMKRLERQSMKFTDAYAVPLCSPTRASILSGQYSSRHRVTSASGHQPAAPAHASPYPAKAKANEQFIYARSKNYLDLSFVTFCEVLRDAGYRTGHFGKWHLGLSQEHWPEKHGFEVAFHAEPSPGPRSYFSPYGVHSSGDPGKQWVGTITDGRDGEYITDRLTDEALRFVEEHQDEPFYLNFWHFAVHGPWGHKEKLTKQFADKSDPRGQQKNPIMASMLKSVDESLGRVMDRFDELGLTDNTLFIFYSDNGGNTHSNVPGGRGMDVKQGHPKWDFVQDWKKWAGDQAPTNNAPLREGKGRIYEGGQRVPLMVRWPGLIEPGSISNSIVGPIDLYPTILEAAGLKKPAGHVVDGESIIPILKQTGVMKRQAWFTWFPHLNPAVSVRQGDLKLIRRFEPHPEYPEVRELYNLKKDIGESNNLARRMPDKVKELDALIDQFVKDTGALYPKPNPDFNAAAPNKPDDRNSDPIAGLVARMCKVIKTEKAVRIVAEGRLPFLGTGQVKLNGPLTLKLRTRSTAGGKGRVQWRTGGQATFPQSAQVVTYDLPAGTEWQDILVRLPVQGKVSVIRLFLPAQKTPVELQSIQFIDRSGREKCWDFSGVSP